MRALLCSDLKGLKGDSEITGTRDFSSLCTEDVRNVLSCKNTSYVDLPWLVIGRGLSLNTKRICLFRQPSASTIIKL